MNSKTEINKHKQKVNDDKISFGKRGKEKMIERDREGVCEREKEIERRHGTRQRERSERDEEKKTLYPIV